MAAAITSVSIKEISEPGTQVIKGSVAASGDYFVSKFETITQVLVTPNTARVCGSTFSGGTVTFLTAAGDVNCVIYGY